MLLHHKNLSLRIAFLTCLLFFLNAVSYGQDSTYQAIMASKNDTSKVMRLFRYAKKYLRTNTAQSRKLNREVINIAEKIHFPFGIGIAYMDIAYSHAALADETEAIATYRKALQYLKKTDSTETIAKCLLNIGNCEEAVGNYRASTQTSIEAIKMLENTAYKGMLARAYTSLGLTYYNIDEHEKALEYLYKALPIVREVKDTSRMLILLYGLSATLSSLERIPEAMNYAKESIKAATAYGKSDQLHTAHQSMADLLCRIEDGKKAIPHALLSLRYAKEVGSMHYIYPATVILADAYAKADNPRQQVFYLNQALSMAYEKSLLSSVPLMYKSLSEAYEKMGKAKESLGYFKKYIAIRDSIQGEEIKKDIAELEVQYKTAQKEKTIAQKNFEVAQKEVQLQKNRQLTLYSIGSTLVALLVALLVYLHFRNKRKLHQNQIQNMQQEKEIQLLQAVMQGEEKERSRIAKDLHDGVAGMLAAVKMHFNSIALHVGGVLTTEGYQQGIRLLDEASQEVRKTSHNLMPEVLLQYGLDEAIRRYCNNVTNSSKLFVQYDAIGEMGRFVDSFELSVYRIVQELLNNIVKHSKASEAIVQLSYQSRLLSITIEDNGIGFSKDAGQKDGIGLKSLKSRVKAMNGKIEFDSVSGQGLNAYLEFETAGLENDVAVSPV
ncbi:MAG TPA: sensor histidine kinase [Flavisolibacter sp.]|jgi:signal transduction histidine kinase/tetratricopeptide (TPR) repeat protein|nr:sensor histidine kinase [Flavisolibacter sp.]